MLLLQIIMHSFMFANSLIFASSPLETVIRFAVSQGRILRADFIIKWIDEIVKKLLDFCELLWYMLLLQGGAQMAQISIEALYTGEGAGGKYGSGGLMGAVVNEILSQGVPDGYDVWTWTELLLIKHALLAAEQMKTEGDSISGLTDPEPSSFRREG